MHGHWFISLEQQEHAFLGSALHFIQIIWFTYIFVNILRVPKWVQFVGCSLDQARNQLGTPGGEKFSESVPNFLNDVQYC